MSKKKIVLLDEKYSKPVKTKKAKTSDSDLRISDTIRAKMKKANHRFHAEDNVSEFINKQDKKLLLDEATLAFEKFLDALLIDREDDPNSQDTARRVAKMYFNEVMRGRYDKSPKITTFPNENKHNIIGFEGLQLCKAEIRSVCSHHHQPVIGNAFIGVLPGRKLVGLSKFIRIAQFLSRRGTLQESLTKQIAHAVADASETDDVAVMIVARHGCCENRGVGVSNSTVRTSYLLGKFGSDSGLLRQEFLAYIAMDNGKSL